MRRASASSAGLPRISPATTTTVSADSTGLPPARQHRAGLCLGKTPDMVFRRTRPEALTRRYRRAEHRTGCPRRAAARLRGEADASINRTAQCYPRGVIPVQQVIPGALEAVLRRMPLTRDKVAFAWRVAVGAAVDRATTVDLRDSVLSSPRRMPHGSKRSSGRCRSSRSGWRRCS